MEPFIGQIIMFGGNFAPRGWAFCDGTLLPISQNTALFSILGTIYGGDGRTTFGLPDLRGRVAVHAGNGPGLTDRRLGQKGGSETNTLTSSNLPAIPLKVSSADATQSTATNGASIATPGKLDGRSFDPSNGFNTATPDVTLNSASVQGGSSTPINNMQPFQVVNYIIALTGIFPSRS
ncbi:phage tail protein [Hyunsoonleella sp. SJ7]|uniref:Phage tail protein n=1 Tax=Hyunsoonleella aquatilis TaxID=2762758 RepID=A0A923HDV2_9FLAO|nr:tail fiber protein [Hyunsoonleella aquatilis]MBC3758353.1 phage tail protein [Hyunsoonleella aquatilis]